MMTGFIEVTETSEIPQSCITKHPDHFAEAVLCAYVTRHSIKFFNEEFNSDYTSSDVTVPVIFQIPDDCEVPDLVWNSPPKPEAAHT